MMVSWYHTKRYLRTRTIWHWISVLAVVLVLFRYFKPKTQHALTDETSLPQQLPDEPDDGIDWSRFAYCQYVTNLEYLCNSLMMFEALDRLGSKADRLLLYPSTWELYPEKKKWTSVFLQKAQNDYKVHIVPVRVQHFDDGEGTWAESFTKLLAFKQTQYERVLSLDSDATLLKPLDDLFLLPSADVAMPPAYWINDKALSSAIMLIEPSMSEFKRVLAQMRNRTSDEFDMDIVNDLYAGNAMLLPNEDWVVSGEFRRKNHDAYMGEKGKIWDAKEVMNRAKYVHFSDWPFPKPWYQSEFWQRQETMPKCVSKIDGTQDCKDQETWLWLYEDFKDRRIDICDLRFTHYLD